MFEHFFERVARSRYAGRRFLSNCPFLVQFGQALFIGCLDLLIAGLNQALDQAVDALFMTLYLRQPTLPFRQNGVTPFLPCSSEHLLRELESMLSGDQLLEQVAEESF
ncbi:hypothetical protein [Salipiger sp.]|uniref:hypothetical protein n=1 Tax=Salipiger sp. TaxID=2078585 RepID=UPI003A96A9CC